METIKPQLDAEQFHQLIAEGIRQITIWIQEEKTSTGVDVTRESIGALIKIYLSQRNLLLSSAREPEGHARLIYQAIFSNFFSNQQSKKRTSIKPTKGLLTNEK